MHTAGETTSNMRSDEITELAKALSLAQGKMGAAVKDSKNPHFKSSYADLASVWEAIREPLSSNGLSVIQMPETEGQKIILTTLLMHTSGQWISSCLTMMAQQNTPQGIGSCITYARRYSLMAVAGVAPAEDDGNAASGLKDPPQPVTKEKAKPLNSCDPEMDFMGEVDQVSLFYKICKEFNISDAEFAKHLVVKCKTHTTGIKIKDLRTFILSQITDINVGDATP